MTDQVCPVCGGPVARTRKLDRDHRPRWWGWCAGVPSCDAYYDYGVDRADYEAAMRRREMAAATVERVAA